MTIDFHTHCFPDALAARVIPMLAERANIPAYTDGTVASLLESMRRSGVDYSVMLQIATKPSQNRTVNTWAIERNEPGIIPFGSVHPLGGDWAEELERLAEAGVRGIKLHPEYQGVYVDDEIMLALYRKVNELGLILLMHAGVDVGVAPPVHGTPQHFARIIDKLPEGRTILAHMGGWQSWDDVERLLVGSHLMFDTSFCYDFMDAAQMKHMIDTHGYEKFVMGSDSPWDSQEAAVDVIRKLGLSREKQEAILGGNAARLLGIAS